MSLLLILPPLRFSDHNVHSMLVLIAFQEDLLLQGEAHFAVNLEIDIVRAFEIAYSPFLIGLVEVRREMTSESFDIPAL